MPPFKIGSVYRQKDGCVVMLRAPRPSDRMGSGFAWATPPDHAGFGYGFRRLNDGTDEGSWWAGESRHLAPGELEPNAFGQWVAIEAGRSLMDGVNARTYECSTHQTATKALEAIQPDPNAAMIARDGPARIALPKPRQLTVRVAPTAKPGISGLQRVYSHTHLLGSYR